MPKLETKKALEPEVIEEVKEEKPVKVTKKTTKKGKVANCELLNVRANSSITAPIVKTLPVGTEIEILGTENEFYKIAEGFVMRAYIAV